MEIGATRNAATARAKAVRLRARASAAGTPSRHPVRVATTASCTLTQSDFMKGAYSMARTYQRNDQPRIGNWMYVAEENETITTRTMGNITKASSSTV